MRVKIKTKNKLKYNNKFLIRVKLKRKKTLIKEMKTKIK
jgi:hypothetical protein